MQQWPLLRHRGVFNWSPPLTSTLSGDITPVYCTMTQRVCFLLPRRRPLSRRGEGCLNLCAWLLNAQQVAASPHPPNTRHAVVITASRKNKNQHSTIRLRRHQTLKHFYFLVSVKPTQILLRLIGNLCQHTCCSLWAFIELPFIESFSLTWLLLLLLQLIS